MDSKIKKYCPNCSQLYIFQSLSKSQKCNLPLFLSCGHSMCEKCITNIVKFGEPIECKVCHNDTQIAASAVTLLAQNKYKIYHFFPINTFMVGELALDVIETPETTVITSDEDHYINLKMLLTDNNQEQGQCAECHNPTSKMCQKCDTVLCDSCFKKSHNNFVIFKNHVLKCIETPLDANNCKTHTKALDYYCKDCSKALCMDCLMVGNEKSCKNHNVVSIQEVNEDMIHELGGISPKINETFRRLTKSAVDVGNLLHHIENETESKSELTKMIPNLEQCFSKLCYVIQKHKKEIFDIVIKLKGSEKYSLQTAKENIAVSLKKINKVMKMIEMAFTDTDKLKQINLSQLLEMAKEVSDTPWFLKKDDDKKDNLKLIVNDDLCTLIGNYIHLEGNSSFVYKLCSTAELGSDFEIPPPPTGLVYPPELPTDVRQLKKPKTAIDKDNQKGQAFHKFVPKYRSKSGSIGSLNSCDSGDSHNRSFVSGETHQKPVIQPVSPFAESQYPKNLQEGTQELIYISHIIDPHNFYVQRACHQRVVKEMMNEFRNAISLPKPSVSHVAEGKIYLAFHKADNMWQRCRVVDIDRRDINKPIFRVFCIDFGSSEIVTIDKLRLLPPARVQSPYPLAINCCLANLVPKAGAWTNDDAFLIQNIIDNKQAVMHIRNIRSTSNHYTMQVECDITTVEHGVSIAHALVFHERAKMPNTKLPYIMPVGIREKPKIYISNDSFKPKSIEEVYITHIVSPDNFFVRKAHHQKIYDKLCEDLEQEYSLSLQTGTVYLPEVGMVCVANVEKYRQDNGRNAWVRGVVREVLGRARVHLFLPDTGELLLLHYSALRHMHHNFTTVNALATECHLAGVVPFKKKWNAGSVSLLHKFENRLLELHVDENRNRGSLSVTLYDKADPDDVICVNNEMIKHKFAVTFGIFNFNKTDDTADQIITDPPENVRGQVKAQAKPKTKKISILNKHKAKTVNDDDLEAKDKGPLRLEAKILNYQSPSLIYMSLVHQQKTFNELFEKIQKHYTKITTNAEREWRVNDRCCTLCIQSQTWRRAVILELENGKAKVFYSDFACIESVPVSQLRELTSEFASIGDAAIKCHLCGVIPAVGEEWPSLTKEYLKELLDAYKRIFITKLGNFKNKSMPIEIWVYHTIQGGALEPNKSEWRCLNKRIIEQGLGIPDKSHEALNPDASPVADDEMLSFLNITGSIHDWLLLDPMPMRPLEAKPAFDSNSNSEDFDDNNDKIDEKPDASNVMFISDWLPPEPLPHKEFTGMPTYIDNDGIIYLHDVSQQDTLDLIRKALDVRFKDPDPKAKYAKWTVGEPCIALFFLDNRFYRGRVVEVNEEASTCLIHYIDYGNEEQCSFTNLRKSIALHQIPTQATKCILSRIQPKGKQWDRQSLDYIHKSIVEKQCYVKVTGNPIGDIIPIELKYDKLWINDHLVEFEMAVFCDGSKAIIRKFAPDNANIVTSAHNISIETDSGPDFIVEEDPESVSPRSSSHDSLDLKNMKGINWNEMLEEDNESIQSNYITYPKYDKDEFRCNICVINDPYSLQLNIDDSSIENVYEEIFTQIQNDGGDLPPLNGIFENKACIALYPEDGLWYRALILQYSESKGKVKVRYVDFGNIEIIPLDDVREIKEDWATLSPLTVAAKLYGVKFNSTADINTVIEEYKNILLDKGPFDVKVIKYEETMPFVELRNENDELINDMLIKSNLFSEDAPIH